MPAIDRDRVRDAFLSADAANSNEEKGNILEDLIQYLFSSIPGLIFIDRDVVNHYESQEMDLFFRNLEAEGGLIQFSWMSMIECKNWATPVGAHEVSVFETKLRNSGQSFGVLVAAHGITGDEASRSAARQVITLALSHQVMILVVTRDQLESLSHTDELVGLLEQQRIQLALKHTAFA